MKAFLEGMIYVKKLANSEFASNQLLSALAIDLPEERNKITVDAVLRERLREIKNLRNVFEFVL